MAHKIASLTISFLILLSIWFSPLLANHVKTAQSNEENAEPTRVHAVLWGSPPILE